MSFSLAYIVLGYITLLGFIDASPVSDTLQDPIQDLPEGYTYTPDVGAHKVYTQWVNWNTARRNCESEGAHLAIPNSVAEAEAIGRLMTALNVERSFIGVHDFYNDQEFVTIHGKSVAQAGYNVWVIGEPNGNSGENCVTLSVNGQMQDYSCNTRHTFVCELVIRQPTVQCNC